MHISYSVSEISTSFSQCGRGMSDSVTQAINLSTDQSINPITHPYPLMDVEESSPI